MEPDEKQCHIDCLANSGDVEVCTTFCEDCVTTNGCWENATAYGDTDDFDCYDDCRGEACVTNLGAGSSLCT